MRDKVCFMIDIETTTADKDKAEVLEIGILACKWTKQGIFMPAKIRLDGHTVADSVYHTYLRYEGQPETNFAKKHQVDLYATCNNRVEQSHEDIRAEILKFVDSHRVELPMNVLGMNASSFDMPILRRHGLLKEAMWVDDGEEQNLVGDFHYRIEDLTGARMLAMRVTGLDYNVVTAAAVALCPEINYTEGKAHDAVWDCYRQLKMYNGLIRLVRGGKMG